MGRWGEDSVRKILEKKNLQFLFQRLKTPFGEVDLVFVSPTTGCGWVVEVKVVGDIKNPLNLPSKKQKQRLKRCSDWLTLHQDWSATQLVLATIDGQSGEIVLMPLVG